MPMYLLTMHMDPTVFESLSEPERQAVYDGQETFMKKISESGEMVGTLAVADPGDSTTVRVRDGKTDVTDGLLIDATPYLCGFYLVDCDNPERARELAALIPDAQHTAVEVRPVLFTAGFTG